MTNWGGRAPRPGDLTATAGQGANADTVVVDPRGVASTGTVSRIDLKTLKVTNTISVGLHPSAVIWDESIQRLYVANGNSDAVSVIDTERLGRSCTGSRSSRLREGRAGIAPTALAALPGSTDVVRGVRRHQRDRGAGRGKRRTPRDDSHRVVPERTRARARMAGTLAVFACSG